MNAYEPTMEEVARRLEGRGIVDGECLIWDGKGRTKCGYAQIKVGGRSGRGFLVHRLSHALESGSMPTNTQVITQKCGRRDCFLADHLIVKNCKPILNPTPVDYSARKWGQSDYPSLDYIKAKLDGRGIRNGFCLEWDGERSKDGYGISNLSGFGLGNNGKVFRIHRLSFELTHGRRIGEGLVINHLCGNRACFSPQHLEEVTQAENVRYVVPVTMTF